VQLLDDRLAPITSTVIFFEADFVEAAAAFTSWQTPIQLKRGVSLVRSRVQGDLESVLRKLLPLTNVEERRFLFIPTRNSWTAFFANGHRGTDPSTYIATLLKCRAVRATAVLHTMSRDEQGARGRWGATIFSLFGPETSSASIRSIYAANDGGKWVFDAYGLKQPFEETERYSARPIKDRFTPDMLDRYLQALGIHAFDEAFYQCEQRGAELVFKQGPSSPKLQEFSLEEVQSVF